MHGTLLPGVPAPGAGMEAGPQIGRAPWLCALALSPSLRGGGHTPARHALPRVPTGISLLAMTACA